MANMPDVFHGDHDSSGSPMSRREFLKLAGAGFIGLFATACATNPVIGPLLETTRAASSPIGEPMPPTETRLPSATPTESPEQVAQTEGISIFDANTFPEKYREIAKNYLTATDAQWAEYQRFVEAARGKFFDEQGITDEVAAIKDINPKLQSLWGMIYWVQNHKDQVIAEQITPVITPGEMRIMTEGENTFFHH